MHDTSMCKASTQDWGSFIIWRGRVSNKSQNKLDNVWNWVKSSLSSMDKPAVIKQAIFWHLLGYFACNK